VDLVKTKDGTGSGKKIFGPGLGPGPEKNKKFRPGPEPEPGRARVWACPQLPNYGISLTNSSKFNKKCQPYLTQRGFVKSLLQPFIDYLSRIIFLQNFY